MQICMLSELFYPYIRGGAERRYYEIAKRLAKKHDVVVYSLRIMGQKSFEVVDGIEIRRLGLPHPMDQRRLMPLASYFHAILKSLGSNHDIIDANQGIASFAGYARLITKRPVVATFHDIYWDKWSDHFPFPYSSIGKFMEFAWSKAKYTEIIANSPETKLRLERLGFKSRISVIPSGLDMDVIKKTDAKKSDAKSGNTIVYVGRLERYKSVDSIMHAMHRLKSEFPDMKLKILGTGQDERRLKKIAENLSINAEFLGFVNERDKYRIIKSSDVLVNPSFVEGMGLIALEAMACGAPVVVRNLKCYFFCNNRNSIRYTDDRQLAFAIKSVLSNRTLRNDMIKNGLKTARKFSWDETVKSIENLYNKLI